MADLSNKALALLLLIAIAVSIGGTLYTLDRVSQYSGSITGRVLDMDTAGKTNFSISNTLSIRFVNALVPFGTGYVNGSACYMGTNNTPPLGTRGCINFNATVNETNLTIENDGNLAVNVSLNFSKNATTFIGGNTVSPSFKYEVINSETGSCSAFRNGSSFREVADYDIDGTNARICTGLDFDANSDLISVGFFVVIPDNAAQGSHEVTVTAVACDDGSC